MVAPSLRGRAPNLVLTRISSSRRDGAIIAQRFIAGMGGKRVFWSPGGTAELNRKTRERSLSRPSGAAQARSLGFQPQDRSPNEPQAPKGRRADDERATLRRDPHPKKLLPNSAGAILDAISESRPQHPQQEGLA